MRRVAYILFFLMLGQIATVFPVSQQKTLKVVTRVTEKEYRFADEFLLDVNAEKASITIKVVSGNTVKLHLEQSAMNADVRVAESELNSIYFVEKKEKTRLYLHNYAQLKASSSSLSSIINNQYTLEVPRHCHIKIQNELGEVSITGQESTMRFDLNYCGLVINDSRGKLYVNSRIGDISLNNCHLNGEFITENVNLKLQDVGGSFDVQSQFGDFSCLLSDQVTLINAKLEQCPATLINRSDVSFSYAIEATKADINILDMTLKQSLEKEADEASLQIKNEEDVGTIIINSEYGDVNLY